ncbi:hypothetical protein AB0H43_26545 [Hamadaea sp. NPDC050747]|uniref:hypothetical protein n=1 Tax=Hamadaea sp. NPDC050747 TaxID=3155789 RepID=UPI0033F217EA
MDDLKSRFLDDLDAEFTSAPTAVAAVSPRSRRRPKFFAYAAVLMAVSGSIVFAGAAPASAVSCNYPDFKNWDHMKWCGIARQDFDYLYTTNYYSARTTCYYFDHYAWMCGYYTRYYAGRKSACRTY